VVSVALLYQVSVPVAHVADKPELTPAQIDAGLAVAAVGAAGMGVTVTVTGEARLLHANFSQAA
jgi:hypothetical protein